MTNSLLRMTLIALFISFTLGAAVGGLSQMTAVSVTDPRPSDFVPPTPPPTASPATSPSPSPTVAATSTPVEESDVWLYTVAFGDSISGLAIRFGTTREVLLELNPEYRENENLVNEGATMIMPCTPIARSEGRC